MPDDLGRISDKDKIANLKGLCKQSLAITSKATEK